MNAIHIMLLTSVLCVKSSADAFRNLGFEEANTNGVRQSTLGWEYANGPTSELLPGWSFLMDGAPISRTGLNAPRIADGSLIGTLFTPGSLFGTFFPPDGNYAFALGRYPGNSYLLTQRGDIPWDANYLFYKGMPGGVQLAISGDELVLRAGLFPYNDSPRFLWFDVSAYAGRNVELQFVVPNSGPFGGSGWGYLDSIGFATSIPEPATLALLLIGGLLLQGKLVAFKVSAGGCARARPQ